MVVAKSDPALRWPVLGTYTEAISWLEIQASLGLGRAERRDANLDPYHVLRADRCRSRVAPPLHRRRPARGRARWDVRQDIDTVRQRSEALVLGAATDTLSGQEVLAPDAWTDHLLEFR